MGQGSGAHQIDGWKVHGTRVDRDRVALPALPLWGWRKNDANYLQGHELQQWWGLWQRKHLHGPWEPTP